MKSVAIDKKEEEEFSFPVLMERISVDTFIVLFVNETMGITIYREGEEIKDELLETRESCYDGKMWKKYKGTIELSN